MQAPQFGPTTIAPPAKPSTSERKERALTEALTKANTTREDAGAVEYFNTLIDKALKYKSASELINYFNSLDQNDYRRQDLQSVVKLVLETPSLYNELSEINVPPNETNTADSAELLYTEIMKMIDEALTGGTKWQKYLADYLQNAFQEQLDMYAGEQWKVYKAIEESGSWLYDSCWAYIYDSENLEGKKARLESILTQIRGNLPSDEEREMIADFSDMYDRWEEY